jgi:hypothetical protein
MGHASPSITLNVYAHLFDGGEQARRIRDGLERGYSALV